MLGYIFHSSNNDDEPKKVLTPEDLKIQEKADVFLGGVMFIFTILFLGFIAWALITS